MKVKRFFKIFQVLILALGTIILPSCGGAITQKVDTTNVNIEADASLELKIAKQQAFERVFDDAVRLDSAMVEKVKTDKPGKRHYIDRDNDGQPEEVWFIDIDPRHKEENSPMLVRVIDEDGDLRMNGEPDRDSDLYIADWNADGVVDVVIDYEDFDGNQDIDAMGMYFYNKRSGLRVWWGRDDGDDNLLWYDVDYTYYQNPCQEKTHFGGDESFYSMHLVQGEKPEDDKWVPFFENPFLFYDNNKDGVSEEVIRVSGQSQLIQTLRWSFDVDGDADLEHPRDYDAGISAMAPGWDPKSDNDFNFEFGKDFNLRFTDAQSDFVTLRGIPSGPLLSRSIARDYLSKVTWARLMFTWDENDLNKTIEPGREAIDRWEGILADSSMQPGYFMPRVGGPSCGLYNKRYEIVLSPTAANEFYFNPSDGRIHIKNCDKAWVRVDYDGDTKEEMFYTWWDTNDDGILDRIEIDIDGDYKIDDTIDLDVSGIKPVKWTFEELNSHHAAVLAAKPDQLYLLNKALTAALESVSKGASRDTLWSMIKNNLQDTKFPKDNSDSLSLSSDETTMYYLGLVGDRRIVKLKKLNTGSKSFWETFNAARSRGDINTMITSLDNEFNQQTPVNDYSKWIAQKRAKPAKVKVAWDNKWFPPNWAWESEVAAYRFFDGHFDMFGKRSRNIFLPTLLASLEGTDGNSVHRDEMDWGMDVLHVGRTSGIGGLTLYVDGVAYPVRKEAKQEKPTFTNSVLEETPDKITFEFLAEEVVPGKTYTIKICPSAIADRKDSPVEILVEGGEPGEKIDVGIGLIKLGSETFISDKATGVMGSWGFQDPEIGWIGMGVIYPTNQFVRVEDQSKEHIVVLKCEVGKPLTYHIQGDWLKGHRFSCCPSAQDWFNELKETAYKAGLK